jgi:hypothetical protein
VLDLRRRDVRHHAGRPLLRSDAINAVLLKYYRRRAAQ